jgi:spore maturation protein CgeB
VGVLSGHRTESYADGDEIRAELGADRNSLDYEDTRHLGPGSWSGLFRSGRIQLQITDPQSVEGGLPFRVFECAASAARLISDTRPELETWCGGTDAVRLAADERAIGMRVAEALAEPETKMGAESLRAHHERFLKRDTWAARFREIAAAAAR